MKCVFLRGEVIEYESNGLIFVCISVYEKKKKIVLEDASRKKCYVLVYIGKKCYELVL